MRAAVLVGASLLSACASVQTPDSAAPPHTQAVHVSGAGGVTTSATAVRATRSNDATFDTLWVNIDKVWATLPAVYAALEIPIGTLDAEQNLFGNSGVKVFRRVGKTPLTKVLDCGRTQIGPSADSYEITISVLTKLWRVDSARTQVTTAIEASGRPLQYAGSTTTCRTLGELERQIVLNLKARLLPP